MKTVDIHGLFGGRLKKDVKEVKKCEECGEDYEVYDLYFDGEYKLTGDGCYPCEQRKEDNKIVREVLKKREERQFIAFQRLSVEPFELQGENFDTYEPKNETQQAGLKLTKQFLNDELRQTTLFFQGDTGLGKTHLSYSVYKHYKDENKEPTLFIDLPSLLSTIRGTYGGNGDLTQERIMEYISRAGLFVLDDIGAEYVKPDANGYESWAADILFQVVNSRQGKKNIYTTNFSSKHLTQKYGMMSKRIISRLMSNARIIKLDGQDHRLKGLD